MKSLAKTCSLPHRGVLLIGGPDRSAFLQGLISNDITHCQEGTLLHAALLTPQGKFLHALFIAERDDVFWVDCEAARAEDLLKRLMAYKLRSKVTLELAPGFEVWASWGGTAPSGFLADPRLSALGSRVIIEKRATHQGSADLTAYDQHRLKLGVPDGSCDMVIEKSTLLEGNFDLLNGISWTKGCYMGQELTARMHYRALTKKRIFPVTITGAAPPFGSIIQMNGEEMGEMRSSCGDAGLALLNVEKAKEGTTLACGTTKLMATKPDWLKL